MRIGFFGTPHLAARVLGDLLDTKNMEVVFVVTNPDKLVGRDQVLRPSPVKELAISKNIPTFTPLRIRDNEEFLDQIRSFHCDYFVVVAYGKILPKVLLEIPTKMCINVHGSILPKYRGASPIQSALLNGERETGVTIMRMSEGMDEGDILSIERITIDEEETSGSLFAKFEQISGKVLIESILGLESSSINPIPQDHANATYCTKIEKEDGLIDWSQSAKQIYHQWQAYSPWPGIFTYYAGKRFLLEKISVIPGLSQNPAENMDSLCTTGFLPSQEGREKGTVVKLKDGGIGVICGNGILTLEQVKLEGKKSQSIRDFVNGNQGMIDYRF